MSLDDPHAAPVRSKDVSFLLSATVIVPSARLGRNLLLWRPFKKVNGSTGAAAATGGHCNSVAGSGAGPVVEVTGLLWGSHTPIRPSQSRSGDTLAERHPTCGHQPLPLRLEECPPRPANGLATLECPFLGGHEASEPRKVGSGTADCQSEEARLLPCHTLRTGADVGATDPRLLQTDLNAFFPRLSSLN